MDGIDLLPREGSTIGTIAWPMDRVSQDDGWRPPAGTRIVSVDDHGIEEPHLWENRLKGADKARALKLWQAEDKKFHMTVDGADDDVPGLDSHVGKGRPGAWDRDERLNDMDAEAPKYVPYNSPAMEPMWAAIAESGIPVMFHIGAYLDFRGWGATGANLTKNLRPHRPLWALLAFSGILERHADRQVVFCEGGFGWVPWTLQDADRVYRLYETELKPKLQNLPSYYFRRQCYSAIMQYDVGLKGALDYDLTDNLLWSCDYPHGESVFGTSRQEVRKIFDLLGDEKAKKVVGATAAKLWNL